MEFLVPHINNPTDPNINFKLAEEYFAMQHYAGAISHYLKCSEWATEGSNTDLCYEALLQISKCWELSGDRSQMELGYILHAISLCPDKPEGYWLLSLYYERQQDWKQCYAIACIGEQIRISSGWRENELSRKVGFEFYCFLFQKGLASWWIGRFEEAREVFFKLRDLDLSEYYIERVQDNLSMLGLSNVKPIKYDIGKRDLLKYKFEGYSSLKKNYSNEYQDLFILSVLSGKKNGWYLEIGSGHPIIGNNTFLLETKFNWRGLSVDINEKDVAEFRQLRKNPVLCKDATCMNFNTHLSAHKFPRDIDYLQLDCNPPKVTYDVLLSIPFNWHRFAVITFEHDYYVDASRKYRDLSRQYLLDNGYVLLVSNVAMDDTHAFEDWYVHPALVSKEVIDRMIADDDTVKNAEAYMLTNRFNWGNTTPEYINLFSIENFINHTYEKHFEVNQNDIVVDIGANCGAFSKSIEKKKPAQIYCVEPSKALCDCISSNVPQSIVYNLAIAAKTGLMDMESPGVYIYGDANANVNIKGFTFMDFIHLAKIRHIDFLKCDCEGGEASIFTTENYDWIVNNVSKIAGEWHINNQPDGLQKFKIFRDIYLNDQFDFHIYERGGNDVTEKIFDDTYLDAFVVWWKDTMQGQFMFYLKNKAK